MYFNILQPRIIFICRFDSVMENLFYVLKIIETMLLLLSGDVHQNPGPNLNNTNNDITICHLNIRSLSQDKRRCIKTSLSYSYDIIALRETFLSNHPQAKEYDLPGFQTIIRHDRVSGIGGRVALYGSRSFKVI